MSMERDRIGRGCDAPATQGRASLIAGLLLAIQATAALAAPGAYPDQREADLVVKDFRLQSGAVLPEVRLHYTTLGTPHRGANGEIDNAVLMLHGTTGTGRQFLAPTLGPELFAEGAPLDARRYFIILPDGLGRGGSSKPSDGLHAQFPRYGYGDVVTGQYRVVTEGLGLKHLKLVMGTSMGGMQTWMWGERYPTMMDALVPIASQPIPISGRNALWRRLLVTAIRMDPDWNGGAYTAEPRRFIETLPIFNIMTESVLGLQKQVPTNADAAMVYAALEAGYAGKADANDWLYWFESSYDYDPSADLGTIKAKLLAINFADDMLNPPELEVMHDAVERIPGAQFVLVPASADTRGHQSLRFASLWKAHLSRFLAGLDGTAAGATDR
ncbi:alpha/beta fold hydrolase [Methylobacterium sp. NEAU K]|uniref:alpha/beta fold hydrolase n=1 Tax=Methylobacterium sp. NEAU K TaxID=3064946 RepID=UPI002734EA9B|nr:alpha/beta fold hydrolase [Methylobacterium sp. NEAU K]MDP4006240.1 alpha/beta fold hydrolase [Methylobacterium sp. NEAU K]